MTFFKKVFYKTTNDINKLYFLGMPCTDNKLKIIKNIIQAINLRISKIR